MKNKILITGASGTVGTETVKALLKSGIAFKAAVRDVEKAKSKLGENVEVVPFDFADSSTFQNATVDVDKVFLLGPPLDYSLDKLLAPFIDYLKEKKIKRVVYLSAYGMETIADELPFHQNVERKLREDDFDLTILRPSFFAQNFLNYEFDNITKYKIVYSPAGEGKVAFVDIRDVGEVAAKVLIEEGHSGKEYALTGPGSFSFFDVAYILSEIVDEKITYPNPTPEEYTQTLKQAGAPDFIAPYMISVYGMIRNNAVSQVSPTIEQLLKRKPGSLKGVLQEAFKLKKV